MSASLTPVAAATVLRPSSPAPDHVIGLFERLKRLSIRSFSRGVSESELPLENTDAWAAVSAGIQNANGGHNSIPPNYVKAYDEGRPRH
jgi:hypothetical protein